MISRRRFLAASAASATTLFACRQAPAILQGDITPQQFGARGGDPIADTLGWNRAVAAAARAGRPVIASGTYILRAPAVSRWNWWRRPAATTHVAVALQSGTRIYAKQAEILVGAPERAVAADTDERHFLFGTGENLQPGTLRDIEMDGLTFDFRDEFGPLHRYTYAAGITGVDGFRRRNLVFKSTGMQGGRGLLSENVRNRQDTNLRHQNIIQGIYTRYENNVTMDGISFDTFVEALDFDGPCWDVQLRNLSFRNGVREAQCIDTGGGARWLVEHVTAENTGSIIYIYVKGNAWPTYRQWLDSNESLTSGCVIPEKMIVRDVTGHISGGRNPRDGEALRVGAYRNAHFVKRQGADYPAPRDITIENWRLTGSGQVLINDCQNLQMHGMTIADPVRQGAAPDADAALVVREGDIGAGGEVSGSISGIAISNAPDEAVSVVAGQALSMDDIRVNGRAASGTPAFRVHPRAGRRDQPRLGKLLVNGSNAVSRDID